MKRSSRLKFAAPVVLALLAPFAAMASPSSVQRGSHIAQANCTPCHTITGAAPSPVPGAPRFPDLKATFPGRTLDEIVLDGLMNRHPIMPQFTATPDDITDVIDYLQTLQSRKPPAP